MKTSTSNTKSRTTPPRDHDEVVFAFNHGFDIEELTLDGEQIAYTFEDGLIRVANTPENALSTKILRITANGEPDTNFGYFDSDLDVYSANARQGQSLARLGSEHAVNQKNYLALTSAIKWYPTSGPAFGEADYQTNTRDQFTVDLTVHCS